MTRFARVALLAAAAMAATGAVAQQRPSSGAAPKAAQAPASAPASVPAAVPSDPQRTTASFGEWTLRCEKLPDGPRLCEIVNSVVANAQGQSSTIAQIAIGRPGKSEPLRVTVVLPTSVSFSATPKIAADEKAKPFFDLAWRRCLPSGCFADAAVDEAALGTLKARTEPARIAFRDGAERDIALPLSTRGLAQALDALAKEGS